MAPEAYNLTGVRTRCPHARALDAEQEPPLRSFGPGHDAACHLPLQPAPT